MALTANEKLGRVIPGAVTDADGRLIVVGPDGTPISVTVSGGVTISDAAEGTPAAAVPTKAQMVAGSDGTNLRALKVAADGTLVVDTELPSAALAADGAALPTAPEVLAVNQVYNGTTVDMMRGNVEGTALASALRTSTTTSANLTNVSGRGIAVFINVTAASGTGGLSLFVDWIDPISGTADHINAAPTAIVATTRRGFLIYPGSSDAGNWYQKTASSIPRTFRIQVVHGDATNYTYSVGYCLLN